MSPLSNAVDQLEAILRSKNQTFHRALNVKLIPHPVMEPGGLILNDLHQAVGFEEENIKLRAQLLEQKKATNKFIEVAGPVQSDLDKAIERLDACLNVRPMTMDELQSEIKEAIALLENSSEELGSIEVEGG